MFNTNDILALMRDGHSADSIAENFADVLNAAIAETKKVDDKRDEMRTILTLVVDWIAKWYPDLATAEILAEIDLNDPDVIDGYIEEIDAALRSTINLMNAVDKLVDAVEDKKKNIKDSASTTSESIKLSAEDAANKILAFFDEFGL